MKKVIIPSLCFAVLSTAAFDQTVYAAPLPGQQVNDSIKYVNVGSGSLNLRKSASSSATVMAKLSKGTQVTVYSQSNGWSRIKVNGKDGYVSSKYLTPTKPSGISPKTQTTTKYVNVTAGSSLNLRKSASTRSSLVTRLAKGTQVTVYSGSDGWSRIKANGKVGYVSSKCLTSAKPPGSTSTKTQVSTKYINVSSGSLNLRKSASTRASVMAKLSKGTPVTVYSESNGWAKIKANGKNGYVSSKYLSATRPGSGRTAANTKITTKYIHINSGTLNVRKSASTSSNIVTRLAKGAQVSVYSEAGGWARIKANGKEGYVSSKYIAATKPGVVKPAPKPVAAKPAPIPSTIAKYVNVSSGSLNMRKSASSGESIITKLAKGTQVTVYSESNGWARVKANGRDGYVSSKYLSAPKPVAAKPAPVPSTVAKYVNVSSGSLNMRNKPDANASIMVKLAKGVQVTVYSESNGWAKIKVYGEEGYVSSKYLSSTKPGTEASKQNTGSSNDAPQTTLKFVNVSSGSSLNMRSAASTAASILTKLAKDSAVTVHSEAGGWARVTANGKTGYVTSSYLTVKAPQSPGNSIGSIDKIYQSYGLTLDEMTAIQMAANAQTDNDYRTYIREDALTLTSSSKGTVKGSNWRVRGGAGPNYWTVGTVNKNQTLTIKSKVKGSDGYFWYEVSYNKSWVNASPEDVTYHVNPNNFVNKPTDSFQFLKLSQTTNLDVSEVNGRILAGKGILQGKAAAFMDGGDKYGVNEMYLISHALLETGNGSSTLATGVKVNGKTVYNMYGIGAYDGSAVSSGAQYAFNAGWFTPEAAIIGGAKFIAQGYINAGQDTLYKMRWNPAGAAKNGYATHQYATDIGWASKQVKQIYNLYSLLNSYSMTLEIPKYK
ncbi:SH3 domain-containing protein [Bacillus sp. V59.32b]|uniref:SH3 domain-containing protein n=1 Tax=Bacillus sp. V59.32b TaxID=1758642 RepID=UPI000E3C74E0|nr:SH3 domain-containing protein [Bacillus sp. V59.32b]RFU66512.1 mannosyl-glycoprotein endo-beta-N-acetylglucosamidase [Bacillus sp. V59.32b]